MIADDDRATPATPSAARGGARRRDRTRVRSRAAGRWISHMGTGRGGIELAGTQACGGGAPPHGARRGDAAARRAPRAHLPRRRRHPFLGSRRSVCLLLLRGWSVPPLRVGARARRAARAPWRPPRQADRRPRRGSARARPRGGADGRRGRQGARPAHRTRYGARAAADRARAVGLRARAACAPPRAPSPPRTGAGSARGAARARPHRARGAAAALAGGGGGRASSCDRQAARAAGRGADALARRETEGDVGRRRRGRRPRPHPRRSERRSSRPSADCETTSVRDETQDMQTELAAGERALGAPGCAPGRVRRRRVSV